MTTYRSEESIRAMFAAVPECRRGSCDDPAAQTEATEGRMKAAFVEMERRKAMKEAIAACYETHGVNHREKCADLVRMYVDRIWKPATTNNA
ncbi:mitochondrial Complex I (CI) NADH:ubiquinone oxidoreductase subunit PDSW/NIDM/NDUFB10 [Andalucia godoyi]|uniref:Mitochondrial Complex I (CI) NADH:ubiquinone oxidoreductase subunit PDSW/NIDM/NDUFB10 n=1 Tax=Andalucia godoyi TaxID=505711 RepID=A0A8K0AII0_ANDGO|nr:mitochondrial Complex I (CI) NADH:ubiquinone oxidoreductase subunit PDSW/NIDM/NDUFB10 [Andalucia godoyi]|eukprot:ANDGO_03750.mRNA.1 mitochondrial Complex I (CI) NADH:ubiquinone oxidoreductase subunit PDSW/NIDM/NDUFB10